MLNDYKQQIVELQEKIHEIKEYLYSDMCRSCGEAAIKLEQHIKELANLISKHTTEN